MPVLCSAAAALMSLTFAVVAAAPPASDWPNNDAWNAVLGFVPRIVLASLAGRAVTLVDPADAVASHARTRLAEAGLARPAVDRAPGAVRLCASGADAALHAAAARWLP